MQADTPDRRDDLFDGIGRLAAVAAASIALSYAFAVIFGAMAVAGWITSPNWYAGYCTGCAGTLLILRWLR